MYIIAVLYSLGHKQNGPNWPYWLGPSHSADVCMCSMFAHTTFPVQRRQSPPPDSIRPVAPLLLSPAEYIRRNIFLRLFRRRRVLPPSPLPHQSHFPSPWLSRFDKQKISYMYNIFRAIIKWWKCSPWGWTRSRRWRRPSRRSPVGPLDGLSPDQC